MKNIMILAAFMFHVVGAAAQKEKADTLLNANEIGKVIIVDGAEGLTVKTIAKDSTVTFDYHQNYGDEVKVTSHKSEYNILKMPTFDLTPEGSERKWRYDVYCNLPNFGFVAGLSTPEGMKIDPWQSAEISWLEMLTFQAKRQGGKDAFRIGFGLSWRNFRMTDGNRFVQNGDVVTVEPFSEDVERDFSRLKLFSLSVPVLWEHRFSKNHAVKIGPVLNFNTYSSLKTRYSDGSREVKELQKGQERVPVTVDFYGAFSIFGDIGLYVRYSPCNVLKTGMGPKIKPLSFGLAIGF